MPPSSLPLTGTLALFAISMIGWAIVFLSSAMVSHFDLFGMRQVWLYLIGRPYTKLSFMTPGFYRYVRHPLYLGFLIGFWATPTMTVAHLVFALTTTAYILIAIQLEEGDLVHALGNTYSEYRRQVPMLIPRIGRTAASEREMGRFVETAR